MRALIRVAAVALAGATLYYAGLVNSIVIRTPDRFGAIVVVLAVIASLAMLVFALVGTGTADAAVRPSRTRDVRLHRATWLAVSAMSLVGLAWLAVAPRQHSADWTPYHNDAIALNECAARLLLEGRDPYTDLRLFPCFEALGIGGDRTTPLQRGLFAAVPVYPSDDEIDMAWSARAADPSGNVEFEGRLSYPSLSVVLIAPWVALGWDSNVLYLLCLLGAMGLIVAKAPAGLRPFALTGLFAAACLEAFTVGGSADLLYALPLVAAWIWRERGWSGLLLGLAVATKQIAWFFVPFYLIAVVARQGPRVAAQRAVASLGIFVLANLPFVLHDGGAWLAGVLAPLTAPSFPRGAGLIFLATNGVLPLWPSAVYAALEAAAGVAVLVVAWRTRHSSPELGVALAVLPLFLARRSLFSYFFLAPLFAYAALVRLPLGDLRPAIARASGAVTLFALPARESRAPAPRQARGIGRG
ncbi:MAG TPA: hypothetical protein VM070_09110 [Candidatus Saccharimonadales bacterium]|nr:hypothetical protein [Candidatus Saccharimonadales bacterium]